MNRPMFRWRHLAFVTCVGLLGSGPAMAELKPGDKAPDFKLKGSDGKTYQLSDFKDKQAVVVAWYPKAFTGGWTKECISFRENGKALKQFDVAYFTASCDEEDVNKKFAKSLDLDYPILSDPTVKTAAAYGVSDGKSKFAKRWTFIIGIDGKVLHIDKKVKAAQHGEDIAAKLKELKIAKKPKKKEKKSK